MARRFPRWLVFVTLSILSCSGPRAESWTDALRAMPLKTKQPELVWSNVVSVLLDSFQSNRTVKALIFLPGAQDEFYFFRKVKVTWTNSSPSLLDAIRGLTNQNPVQATFREPFLLIHTRTDWIEPKKSITDKVLAEQLRRTPFRAHVLYNDREWDLLLPELTDTLRIEILPKSKSPDSWHFYRHSFAAWHLTAFEAFEAIALAGKTSFAIERNRVAFRLDERRATP
jgi:hypothetical protein